MPSLVISVEDTMREIILSTEIIMAEEGTTLKSSMPRLNREMEAAAVVEEAVEETVEEEEEIVAPST